MSRGCIVPIGGAEAKVRDAVILRRFVDVCGGADARIAVIPTASASEARGRHYERVFGTLGAGSACTVPLEVRDDCFREDSLEALRQATGVFLTGGNQLRLSTTLGGTPVADLLRERNRQGLPVGGTSAGAAFLCEHMIAFGQEGPTPRADMVTLAPGLGLTARVIIDQHFGERDRLGRLITALAYNPRPVGLGLDEDTAVFLDSRDRFEVVGSGAITVVDPGRVEFSSMDSAHQHDPVCVIGLRLHILIHGTGFDLAQCRATPPPMPNFNRKRRKVG